MEAGCGAATAAARTLRGLQPATPGASRARTAAGSGSHANPATGTLQQGACVQHAEVCASRPPAGTPTPTRLAMLTPAPLHQLLSPSTGWRPMCSRRCTACQLARTACITASCTTWRCVALAAGDALTQICQARCRAWRRAAACARQSSPHCGGAPPWGCRQAVQTHHPCTPPDCPRVRQDNAAPWDLSSTERFQRDRLGHFLL